MKNLRLFIILGLFAIITTVVVLCSTVFTLNTVALSWTSTTNVLSSTNDTTIIETGKFDFGKSIFLMDKDVYKQNLEKQNPYLKVENIEIMFPNKIVVKTSERQELYALKITDPNSATNFSYVYLDYEFKILRISETVVVPNNENPPVLVLDGLNFDVKEFSAGEYFNSGVNTSLLAVGDILTRAEYSNSMLRALIESVTYEANSYKSNLIISTTYGIEIKIIDIEDLSSEKILFGISIYNQLHNENPENNTAVIEVRKTESGKIEAVEVKP